MRVLASVFLAVLIPCRVLAAGQVTSAVSSIRIDQSGNGMVFFDQNINGTRPGCMIVNYQNALAFNANTAGGKAIYAMALAAKATGTTISVFGLGTCNVFGGFVEDWDYGVLQ